MFPPAASSPRFETWLLSVSPSESPRARLGGISLFSDYLRQWAAVLLRFGPTLLNDSAAPSLNWSRFWQRWEGKPLRPSGWAGAAGTHWVGGYFSSHQNGFTMNHSSSLTWYCLSPINKDFKDSVTTKQNIFHLAKSTGFQPVMSSPRPASLVSWSAGVGSWIITPRTRPCLHHCSLSLQSWTDYFAPLCLSLLVWNEDSSTIATIP